MDTTEFPVELVITRGLPASGKSTWARGEVDIAAAQGRPLVRINRDDLRRMALKTGYSVPEKNAELWINKLRDGALERLLTGGVSVILDDTNLRMRFARDLADLAQRLGVGFRAVDFLDVSLETCVARDAARGRAGSLEFVGEHVIRQYHNRYLSGGRTLHDVVPRSDGVFPDLYVPVPGRPDAVMVDLDGTLALLNGRNPYDETCVLNDLPNQPVIDVLSSLLGIRNGRPVFPELLCRPIFVSARTLGCLPDTLDWLVDNIPGLGYGEVTLFMRKEGDNRPDAEVKLDLFNEHIRDYYNVKVVLDDRNSVVKLWRSMGLTCLQVADGDF